MYLNVFAVYRFTELESSFIYVQNGTLNLFKSIDSVKSMFNLHTQVVSLPFYFVY